MSSAWAGVAVGAVAAIPAYIGIGAAWVKAGVADGRAERAEERAEGALEAYQRMADALDRMVEGGPRGVSIEGAPVAFALEWRRSSLYTLRNLGPNVATDVRIDPKKLPIARGLPDGITLRPLESVELILVGRFGMPVPGEIEVTCAELTEPTLVPVPPKF